MKSKNTTTSDLRRGWYVEKIDRDLLRPLYIITPAGLEAWKGVEGQIHNSPKDK